MIRYRIIRVEKAANCRTNRSRRPTDRPANRAVGRKLKLPMFGWERERKVESFKRQEGAYILMYQKNY